MSVENENQNTNENENQNVNENDFSADKYKDNAKFTEFLNNYVTEKTKGIVKNRDDLLTENKSLKEVSRKVSQDEVTRLLIEGSEESRKKAIEMLTADAIKPYTDLIAQKDEIIKSKEDFENQVKVEKEQAIISKAYDKLSLNSNIDEEAHKDILPVVFQNFKVEKGELVFTGKDINAAGKPLTLEEFIIKYVEDGRKYYLKDRSGSNALFKTTTENVKTVTPNEETYEQYNARMQAEAAARRSKK